MNRNYLRLIPLAVLFLLVMIAALGLLGGGKRPMDSPMIGKRVNFFDMPVLYGNARRFTPSIWEGKVSVVNFFASWCKPCMVEHPALMRLAQYVPVYGVAWKDKSENITNWLLARGNPYQAVGLDMSGKSTVIFGLTGVPETYVIDAAGVVRYSYRAQLTDEVVNGEILPLVEKLRSEFPAP